ncbi:MAG: phosphate ABC transporter ATP-binding protein PstB [Candidatus Ancillula sp.]|nr:phosphate ABC transporter ATP-binding protein PstB [Candidatus Ancillula sp.]
MEVKNLNIYYGDFLAVEDVNISFKPRNVTALIGPSGCGKSTFLRSLNRMHEVTPGARITGEVLLDGRNLYDKDIDPSDVRAHIGMVFQRPNPFPTMSIRQNVLSGAKLSGQKMSKEEADELVKQALSDVNLWEEVKDRLDKSALGLSGGQQQRLCIARAVAVSPAVILMDEPCSALDPISTKSIEELITKLKKQFTIVIVTHNMQQAQRVSDNVAFFNIAGTGMPGKLIETGSTNKIFDHPDEKATKAYIHGRFG